MTFSGAANVVLGDDFIVRIVVDSKAENQVPDSAVLYFYESATITVGGYSVSTGTGPFNSIVVAPFSGLFGNDRFEIQYHNPEEQWLGLINLQGPNVFQNVLLPQRSDNGRADGGQATEAAEPRSSTPSEARWPGAGPVSRQPDA